MNNILISIVVPACNIEAYIGRCLDSILAQQYKTLEIIVVDDGSIDETGKIIDRYALSDKRVIAIHKENKGVTSARLDGVRRATGEYIGFVDGDDFIEPEMFQRLLDNAIVFQADISHCGYRMVFPNRVDYYYGTGDIVQQDKMTGLKDLLSGEFVEPGVWNKLFHQKLFHDLLSNEYLVPEDIKINEDILMNYWLFKAANSMIYEDFCPYHYILRKGSAATAALNEEQLRDPIRVMKIIEKDTIDIPELNKIAQERLISQLINIATLSPGKQIELIRNYRKKGRNKLRQILPLVLKKTDISKMLKIKVIWVVIFPTSYRWLHTLYTRIMKTNKKYRIEENTNG